jgi:NMD protein affecting ribosome stability and mRNA decay
MRLNIEMPKRRREEREFPKGDKELIVCPKCDAVYYNKSWHHNFRNYKHFNKDKRLDFKLCPACNMIKNRQFEGKIEIRGIPQNAFEELKALVEAYSERAYRRDPMDRLVSMRGDYRKFVVVVTENQLAQKLAKKIRDVFKKVKVKISYSAEPSDVVYIKIEFTKPS